MARPREFDREKVLRKAMHLFWKQGYEATSVQDLGVHLDLRPGSLYNTFHDKHTLFLETLETYDSLESERVCQLLLAPDAGKAAIEQLFYLTVEADANDVERKGCFMVNSAAELAARDPEVRSKVAASRSRLEQALHGAIVNGQANGEINPCHDPHTLAAYFVNALFGLRLTAKVVPERAVLLQIVEQTLSALR